MTSTQPQQPPKRFNEGAFVTGGREIALMVVVLAIVALGMVATYWVRSRNAEASNQPAATTTAAATSWLAAFDFLFDGNRLVVLSNCPGHFVSALHALG
jgi:hypothetical protein